MRELAPADGAAPPAATTRLDYILAGALVVVIALVSYQQLVTAPRASTAGQQASVTTALPQSQPRGIAIAVLPFANMSGDASQEFFSDGITEEINAALTKVPDLRVVARTSAFEFKGQNRNIRTVGESLGATHLIEGSVRKFGNRVRIAAQLVQADNGLNVWSESYDRELIDIFSIQEDIAKAIAASLRVPLGLQQGDSLVRNRINDLNSYDQYLRARALVRSRGGQDEPGPLTEAASLLESVVARDPDYAPAWALLAQAYGYIPTYHRTTRTGVVGERRRIFDTTVPKAEAAAQRAIQLDPNSSEGYMSLGLVQQMRTKLLLAEEFYSKSLALDPSNPDALNQYAYLLAGVGRLREALATREKLQALEPFVPAFNLGFASALWLNGQSEAAITILKALPPERQLSVLFARIYSADGRYGEAADIVRAIPLGAYLPGQVDEAVRLLRTAPARVAAPESLPSLGNLGFVFVYVGAPTRALDIYEDNLEFGSLGLATHYLWQPSYASVRATERFKALMRSTGMMDYWRARGWPDLCRPMGADDFVCD